MLLLFAVGRTQDDARRADGEQGAVLDDAPLPVAEYLIIDKSTSIARTVAEHIFQLARLDHTVEHINAGVVGLDGRVDLASFHIAAYRVVAHVEWKHLLVVEDIFDDQDRTAAFLLNLLFRILFFLYVAKAGYTHTNAELLLAVRAFEYQSLARLVFRLIKGDEVVAFRTSYSLHLNSSA